MIFTLAAKELKSLFASPLAWVVLTLLQTVVGFGFLKRLDDFLQYQAQLIRMPNAPGATEVVATPVYATLAIVFLFAVPLLGMRLVAEERRNQTMPFLISSPLSMTQIVLGKFLGLWLFLLGIVALMTLMPLTLTAGGRLDFGLLASLALGMALTAASFAAVSLYVSCLTVHPFAAAVGGFGALLAMVLVGDAVADNLRNRGWDLPAALVNVVSPLRQFEPFTKGMIDSYAIACSLLLTVAFLALAVRRLDAARLRG